MGLKNTKTSYGSVAKTFHWVIALLIIALLIVGNVMVRLDNAVPYKFQLYGIHKATGILVLALVIARLCWRIIGTSLTHDDISPWQRHLSFAVHWALYLCMILMPLSGWVMSSAGAHPISFYGLFTVPPIVAENEALAKVMVERHGQIGWIIIVLLVAHIGAALLHHFYYKDNVLKRMLP